MPTIRIPDELQGRLDGHRGDVPRERYVRRLLGEALDALDAQQGGPSRRVVPRVPSAVGSSAARAGVTPRPKAGR